MSDMCLVVSVDSFQSAVMDISSTSMKRRSEKKSKMTKNQFLKEERKHRD